MWTTTPAKRHGCAIVASKSMMHTYFANTLCSLFPIHLLLSGSVTYGNDHNWTGDIATLHGGRNWADLLQGPSERLMKCKLKRDDNLDSAFPNADLKVDSGLEGDFRVAEGDDVDTKVC